jgi:hypothetical protein
MFRQAYVLRRFDWSEAEVDECEQDDDDDDGGDGSFDEGKQKAGDGVERTGDELIAGGGGAV